MSLEASSACLDNKSLTPLSVSKIPPGVGPILDLSLLILLNLAFLNTYMLFYTFTYGLALLHICHLLKLLKPSLISLVRN